MWGLAQPLPGVRGMRFARCVVLLLLLPFCSPLALPWPSSALGVRPQLV